MFGQPMIASSSHFVKKIFSKKTYSLYCLSNDCKIKVINNYLLLSNLTYEVKYRFMISELKRHAVLIWFIQ